MFFFTIFSFSILLLGGCATPTEPSISMVWTPDLTGKNASAPSQSLVITEIGSAYYYDSSTWIEVYNRGSRPQNLSTFTLRCTSQKTNDLTFGYTVTYSLPSMVILPGRYALIRSGLWAPYGSANGVAVVSMNMGGSSYVPRFGSGGNGFAELIYQGTTVDFVRFGTSTDLPFSGNFSGTAPAIPAGTNTNYGFSIGRNGNNADNDSGSDWTFRSTATPGGANDVTSATDVDNDGIPDACEAAGSTFAGMPLYDWGARPGQKDLFLHVDYMDSTDPGILPNRSALDRVREVFAAHGIAVHFDVGNLFHVGAGISTNDHDLSDTSHRVPFALGMAKGAYPGYANIYDYKNTFMPLNRREIFHYVIFANSQQADGAPGSSGISEIQGNDFMVTLGGWMTSGDPTNRVVNYQAGTLMHELGHNLGLLHGGFENNNYKPNYLSIMNYLYQLYGLPVIGAASEGDRYFYVNGKKNGMTSFTLLDRGPDASPALFQLDYSSGVGSSMNELSIMETAGLGRTGSIGIDFDLNGSVANGYSMNLNSNYSTAVGETHQDYNDWGNLYFNFRRTYDGDTTGMSAPLPSGWFIFPSLSQDAQTWSEPCALRPPR